MYKKGSRTYQTNQVVMSKNSEVTLQTRTQKEEHNRGKAIIRLVLSTL